MGGSETGHGKSVLEYCKPAIDSYILPSFAAIDDTYCILGPSHELLGKQSKYKYIL